MSSPSILLLLYQYQRRRGAARVAFRRKISAEARTRGDRFMRRRALRSAQMSTIAFLIGFGCNQSLITLTGSDHKAFNYLLDRFKTMYNSHTPYSSNAQIPLFLSTK